MRMETMIVLPCVGVSSRDLHPWTTTLLLVESRLLALIGPLRGCSNHGSMPHCTYREFLCWLDLEPIFYDITTRAQLQAGRLIERLFIDIYRHYSTKVHLSRRSRWLEIIEYRREQFWVIRFIFSKHGVTITLIAKLNIHTRLQLQTYYYQF